MNSMPQSEAMLRLLFNATWQSALLMLIVLLLVQLAGRWIPPAWRVVLWTIPLLRLVVPVLPMTTFSLFQFVGLASAPSPEASPAMPVEIRLALPLVEPMRSGSSVEGGVTTELSAQTEAETSPTQLAWLAIAIWISGVVILAARWLHLSVRLRRILTRKEDVSDPALQSLVQIARYKAKLVRSVRCVATNADIGPATCGLLRPKIVISKRLARELSPSDLYIVIAHEVEHIRRCDFLLVTLGRVATALHWFNPLAYFIHKAIQREIELAVDAATISRLGATRAQEYGSLLLRIAGRAHLSLGVVQMASPGTNLRCRIEQLARWRRPHWCQSLLGAAIACALALVGLSDNGPKSAMAQSSADKDAVFAAGGSNEAAENDTKTESKDSSEGEAARTRFQGRSGRVIDAVGKPLHGARLFSEKYETGGTVTKISTSTDENGEFLIEYPTGGREHGPLLAWAYAAGHGVRVVNMSVTLADDSASERDIRLPPIEPREFVIHLPSGRPCVNAVVRPRYVHVPNGAFAADEPTGLASYLPEEMKPLLARRTDEDGRVTIESIPLALLNSIEVETPEYGLQHFRKLDRTLRLAPVGKINGLLRVESPKDFAGTKILVITDQARNREITAQGRSLEGIAETVLDAAGGFQIPAIAHGNVSIRLSWEPSSEAHPFVSTRPNVLPDETLDLVIQVRPTIPVTGRVIASDTQQPIVNARISHGYQDDDTLRIPIDVVTDENGRYSIRLAAGEVITRQVVSGVVPPYEYPRSEPITIPSASKAYEAEEILVNPMRLVTGKLVDADNNAISSATVVLHTGAYRHVAGKAETRADGSFEMRVRNWDYFSNSTRGRWYWATLDTPAVNAAPPQFTPLKILDDNPDALLLQRP
jgi:beta-lactamase regulating signal transducer with metallopeptidase domain